MEDVKDKMKNLFKKANKPFSSSSAFKGQAHILGSSPSSSPSPSPSPSPSTPSNHTIKKPTSDKDVATCIHSFLSSEPGESSVEIMIKVLRNVAQDPENEKFRKIRMGNPRIKEAIGDVSGGVELLEFVGFRIEEEDGERWARMRELTRERIEGIEDVILLLEKWKGKDDGGVGRLDGEKEREGKMIDRKVV